MTERRSRQKEYGGPERRQRARREEDLGSSRRPFEQRRHPRREKTLPIRVFRRSKSQNRVDFQASIRTRDMSIGGVYVESTFFLKKGLELDLEFELPDGHAVLVSGVVVYVIDEGAAADDRPTGFAIHFNKFHGDSEIHLRAFLARGDLERFVAEFAASNLRALKAHDYPKLIEMIMRWEMLQEALSD